ncbi:MAPEG family protein [Sphingomonas sp. DG1-23]|uniref:MAPEG family protein n=1 Tax=Sphingomonas sp. DG1-23 TaxID=3068316 RepID=UPI00273D9515|nr:MAPEG family protein [Sphingomonas sp. DG1-23]MDP5280542.1 MAPEG family protein [Sphingomonas sp. DG1-23]
MTPRGKIALAVALSLPPAGLLWIALCRALPPIHGDPMEFALGCSGAALLLTLALGIEAVAHERLFHASIDPLAGADSSRLAVNQRYLQNTLEQAALFVPALFLLARHAGDLRIVAATAIIWTLGRWAYWIGYHIGPMWRGIGVFSMGVGLATLAYGVGAFGHAWAGWIGVAALLGPLALIEAYLFLVLRRPA